jgi:hypothetical protein
MSLDGDSLPLLVKLPWYKPLERWTKRDAKFLEVRSGLSRHIVRFISRTGRAFAIKETSPDIAEKEFASYLRLRELGVPTLMPVGTVIRTEGRFLVPTPPGPQPQVQATGYLITRLLEYSRPDSTLFGRDFTRENRRRIWDAVVRLFVQLHCKGVYWGDASLANMMIVFVKHPFPEVGVRTVLRAVLADAETVEFHPALSDALRRADVDFFLESMAWTEEDMRASGVLAKPLMTAQEQEYIFKRYLDLYEVEREEQRFELITKIDVDARLGPFEQPGQSKALLAQIYEHKWYLSERERREVPVEEAARDWYMNVFIPVLRLFNEFRIMDEFPERTAVSLYLDIMLHKYYLSEQVGKDVGLLAAFEVYSRRFTGNTRTMEKMSALARSMRALLTSVVR